MSYFHLVIIHMSAWFCLIIAADVYKKGAPHSPKHTGNLLISAFVLAIVLGLISGHAHGHYMNYLAKVSE